MEACAQSRMDSAIPTRAIRFRSRRTDLVRRRPKAGRTTLYRVDALEAAPEIPDGVIQLTRRDCRANPPDILFLSLEMMHRELGNPPVVANLRHRCRGKAAAVPVRRSPQLQRPERGPGTVDHRALASSSPAQGTPRRRPVGDAPRRTATSRDDRLRQSRTCRRMHADR